MSDLRRGRDAVDRLVVDCKEWRAIAKVHCTNRADVEDAIQGAFEIAMRKLPRSVIDAGAEGAWFNVVLRRECWRLNRRSRRRAAPSLDQTNEFGEPFAGLFPDPGSSPDEVVEETINHERRVEAVESLKPDERTALVLLGLGASYREIGDLRGWTQTKVNRCIAEGRERARELVIA